VGLIRDISVKSLRAAGVAIVAVSLLSIVGLPPFLMFLAKALIVQELIGRGKIL
jgi:formate hydrogenlyase subunit 3/multisubunit Na+/H+ antiporter MnhD subunit